MKSATLAVLVASAVAAAPAAHAADTIEPLRFALVVGANAGGRPDLPRLRFADDDAIRNAEVLRALGAQVTLLIAPDDDTRALFPGDSATAEAPTRARLLAKVATMFRDIAAAKARGRQVDFYFVFAGHGGFTDGGEGALFLPDGALTRRDLYDSILSRSPADFNHLIIDACHAYFFVSSRGADDVDARLDARAREYLDAQTLEHFPNTGVAVATSAADTTVEWSDYQGGVFSHEVRSALLGGGDVDGDHQVTYAELGAFIAAANSRVVHVRAKLNVFVRAPARARTRPLTDWTRRPLASLSLDGRVTGHLWLEDERGVRLSEVNKAGGQPLRLALLDRERFYLRLGDDEYAFEATPGQEINQAALTPARPHASERGSITAALRSGLFAAPYGLAFYEGYVLALASEPAVVARKERPAAPSWQPRVRPLVYGLLAGAAATGVAALILRGESNGAYGQFQDAATPADRQRWATRTNQLDWATLISAIVAGGSAAAAAGILARDNWRSP